MIWAAGVTASRLAARLGELTGAERDRAGRVTVEPDLTLPGHPEVFAFGDMVRVRAGRNAPPGRGTRGHAAGPLRGEGHPRPPARRDVPGFRYRDKGNLATIGRAAAVADIKGLKLSGLIAWMTWLFVHLFYLIGFQNRIIVLVRWAFSFTTRGRGARLITSASQEEPPATGV